MNALAINQIFFEVKTLKNLTSEINLLKNQQDLFIEALEFDEVHVVFEVASNSCRKGQLVHVEGLIHIKLKTIEFHAHGKISDTIEIGNNRLKVFVELHSYDKDIWKEFTQGLAEEQGRVDQIFQSMKGEDE